MRSSSVRTISSVIIACLLLFATACTRKPDPNTLVMIIENSPTNLDPRVGTDAQSERIDELLFDALVRRDEHFNLQPWLAERWEIPDPLTYIFHLRPGVRFHDGRPLTARDVKWTLDSMTSGKVRSAKASTYQYVQRIDTPDDRTVVIHLSQPFATLLWNLSDGAFGVVPYGSDESFNRAPIGTGPFKFVSLEQDKEVIIARNDDYWHGAPSLERVRFTVVPETTTRALELRKGSADVAINALTADMVVAERRDPRLRIEVAPGTIYTYIALNLRDPILKDVRVRQALAYAIDRGPLIHYLWRDLAEPARSILPPQHWAFDPNAAAYNYDPARAGQLLDAAGYRAARDGIRFHLALKTTTEESNRLLSVVLQQQLRAVGIALDIRSYEFATFYSDVVKGQFQLFTGLRWIGGNQDPDIFEAVFHSASFPPHRFNRGFYSNPRVDALINQGRSELDQAKRKRIYGEVQEILNRDLPYIHLWYFDNVLVHSTRVADLQLNPSGNYDFLATARIVSEANLPQAKPPRTNAQIAH
jgi:peptide/nickel transport system substrate-binding protein